MEMLCITGLQKRFGDREKQTPERSVSMEKRRLTDRLLQTALSVICRMCLSFTLL